MQNDLAQKCKLKSWVLGSKIFLEKFFSENLTLFFANFSFIFPSIIFKFFRHMQNDLVQKRKLKNWVSESKIFLKKICSENLTLFFANYTFIFHPIMLKFYRHVQNDLSQKCQLKNGLRSKNFLKVELFFVNYFFIYLIDMCIITFSKM